MDAKPPDPGVAGAFSIEDLFFSTTDAKGHILNGNPVFSRVSGYGMDEMEGRAHNLVRHEDTPRLVFRVLWEHLKAGDPVAAYVKNRTKDGGSYWVVATAIPVPGSDRLLSVRFAPSTEHFTTVQGVYEELHALEKRIEMAGGKRADAIDASAARLTEILGGLGLSDYGALMRTFLPDEIRSREAKLAGSGYWERLWDGAGAGDPHSARDAALREVVSGFRGVYQRMQALFATLEGHVALGTALASRSRDLTGDTRLLSLNAMLSAARLGSAGATLAVVAGLVGTEAERAAELTADLNREADELHRELADIGFRISIGRLLVEMAVFSATELLTHPADPVDGVVLLSDVVASSLDGISAASEELAASLRRVNSQASALGKLLHVLGVLQVNGTIEASRTAEASDVRQLFTEMRERLEVARGEVVDLARMAGTAAGGHELGADGDANRMVRGVRERARVLAGV